MPGQAIPSGEISLEIPSNLGAAQAREVHERLAFALRAAEVEGRVTKITLPEDPPITSALALQLLVSAARSFPKAGLSLDARSQAALATLVHDREL